MLKTLFVSLLFSLSLTASPIYFWKDKVIKPVEPDCINKRTHIPCRRTAQAEALAYAIADLLGLGHLTPETHLALIPFDGVEKLCSVQQYLPNIENLRDLAAMWLRADLSDATLLTLIDPTDFENLFLLILLFYDTDAHANNIYACKDDSGIYHLIKLDNGLTFPDKNRQLFNALYLLPQARKKFSPQAIARIQTLPMEQLAEKFSEFEMQDAYDAFVDRVAILKQLTDYSMREIDIYLRKF